MSPAAEEQQAGSSTTEIRVVAETAAFPWKAPREGLVALAPAVFLERLVRYEPPVYPPAAAAQGIEGLVRLQVESDRAGQVSAVRIVAGDAMLGEAAAAAVRQWTMEPMEIGGWRVEAYTEIEISFALRR